MGDGLRRAFGAAARTRADASLTPEMERFLRALPADGRIVTPAEVPISANREQDRARQRCKKFAYAWMEVREDGKRGWQITEAGRKALALPASAGRD